MGNELPGFHCKLEGFRGFFPPSPCRLEPGELIKGLLDLYDGEGLIIKRPSNRETAATDFHHLSFSTR